MNKRSKVQVSIYIPSLHGGGAERVMVALANGFAVRGVITDLVLAKAEGPYLSEVSRAVRIVDLGAERAIKSMAGLVSYLRKECPTAVLSALNHANVIALLARRIAGCTTRVVVSQRSTPSAQAFNNRSIRTWIECHSMRWFYPQADAIVSISHGVASDLTVFARISPQSITTIYNPIELAKIANLATEPIAHTWFEPGSPPVILGVGRLHKAKDFQSLIKAFAQVQMNRSVRLVILGEGELRPQLEAQADELGLHDVVDFPGFVKNPFKFMRSASLFVLSSAWEGFSNVLVEAMACGTPVVSTACPSGPSEILQDGKWGRLVPVGDVAALAQAMAAALDDPQPPDVRIRAADFLLDRAVDAYLRVLLPENA